MELESIAVGDILEVKAVLDSSTYNSLLTVSVQTRRKNNKSVFVFQCHDVRVRTHTATVRTIGHTHTSILGVISLFHCYFQADFIQRDLSGLLSNKSRSR